MKVTISSAMQDLREEFLSRIYKGYPDHKKTWKVEEIEKEFSGSMYTLALLYLEKIGEETP